MTSLDCIQAGISNNIPRENVNALMEKGCSQAQAVSIWKRHEKRLKELETSGAFYKAVQLNDHLSGTIQNEREEHATIKNTPELALVLLAFKETITDFRVPKVTKDDYVKCLLMNGRGYDHSESLLDQLAPLKVENYEARIAQRAQEFSAQGISNASLNARVSVIGLNGIARNTMREQLSRMSQFASAPRESTIRQLTAEEVQARRAKAKEEHDKLEPIKHEPKKES